MLNNVFQYLEESANLYADKIACQDVKDTITYKQLICNAEKLGTILLDKDQQRKPIVVYMDKGCKMLSCIWGIIRAGAFYSVFDTTFPDERIKLMLEVLKPEIIITDTKHCKRFQQINADKIVINIEEILSYNYVYAEKKAVKKENNVICDIDPVYANFTSGSTGIPKCVLVNHKSVIDFIEHFVNLFDITKEDVIGNQAPFDFDVSVKDIFSAVKVGATLQLIPKKYFSFLTELLSFLQDRKVTTLIWAVSALCMVSGKNAFEYKRPEYINKIIFSGEVMPINHLQIWQEAYPGAKFVNVYGPTEITCNCTYHILDKNFKENQIIPIGKAFPNERVFLLKGNKQVLESGVKGEICVSGTAVSLGYYGDYNRTKKVFVQNPLNPHYKETIYKTGDIGYYDSEKNLCFYSRKDNQIKYLGHRIELSEIEKVIMQINGVTRCFCHFDKANEQIVVFFEGNSIGKEIIDCISGKLPKYMMPKKFIFIEEFPINKNGKIDRKEIIAYYMKNGERQS